MLDEMPVYFDHVKMIKVGQEKVLVFELCGQFKNKTPIIRSRVLLSKNALLQLKQIFNEQGTTFENSTDNKK